MRVTSRLDCVHSIVCVKVCRFHMQVWWAWFHASKLVGLLCTFVWVSFHFERGKTRWCRACVRVRSKTTERNGVREQFSAWTGTHVKLFQLTRFEMSVRTLFGAQVFGALHSADT